MPVADPASMYLFFNALGEWRTVTITSTGTGTPIAPVTCTKAVRGNPMRFKTLQLISASMVRPECMYSVPIALAAGPWKPGDTLTDANQVDATSSSSPGVTYTVYSAEMDEGFWILYCFNPKISFYLKDTCTIKVATDTLNALGDIERTFADLYTSVACRIQPSDSNWAMQHGRVGDLMVYDVYMVENYNLQPSKHIITWTVGADTFEADIRSVKGREDIADLTVFTVELRPGVLGAV